MTVIPFSSLSAVTPELRRAAESHEGRKLTDHEVIGVLQQAVSDVLTHWTAVGAWMIRLDNWHPAVRHPLSGIAVNNPSQTERDRRSASMKRVWAAKRARGERLPALARAPSREFGQRVAWRTPEQKVHQSVMMRQSWARRKLEAKEA